MAGGIIGLMTDLGRALRAWRDRVSPMEVGLVAVGDRRSPGLRREELALLAGLSVDYLVRLEQGRATNPSAQVLGALARALRLSTPERDVLFRTAGVAPPSDGLVPTHIGPGLARIIDRLDDTPAGVFTAAWDFVEGNAMWHALFGSTSVGSAREANLVWRTFVGPDIPLILSAEEADSLAREMVADLHATSSVYPADRDLADLIGDLRSASSVFDALWGTWQVATRRADRKVVDSPVVGVVTVDCDVLSAADSDLRVVVYTAARGSDDAEKLDLLRAVGVRGA